MSHKRFGFFFELSEADQRSELSRLRQPNSSPQESNIIEYLRSGVDAGVAMTVEHDLLSDPPISLGEAVLKTDGEWMWPASLAYYVETYHIQLPDDFVSRMAASGWRVPANVEFVPEVPEGHVEM